MRRGYIVRGKPPARRSSPRRKKPLKPKPPDPLLVEADALWTMIVLSTSSICTVRERGCLGAAHLQAHHIISRGRWGTRFELANGLVACMRCHLFFLHRSSRCLDPPQWYRDHGIDFDALKLRAESVRKRSDVDLKLVILDLKAGLDSLTGRPGPEPTKSPE